MIIREAGNTQEERYEYNMRLMRAWNAEGPAPTCVCVDCGDDDAQEDEVYGDILCVDCFDKNHSHRKYPPEFY